MSSIKNVAIFGATGTLGHVLLTALTDAGFNVTAITRPDSSKRTTLPGIQVKTVVYDDVIAVTAALKGQDAVIEAFNPSAAAYQDTIVKASLAAGVSHLITPDFSSDTFNPHVDEILIFEPKRKAQHELERLVRESGDKLSWTAVIVGGWYDWGIQNGAFWVNKTNRTVTRVGSGNQRYAISRLELVGKAVVNILSNPQSYRNRAAYFASHTVTTNQLIRVVKEVTDGSWKVVDIPLEGFIDQGRKLWEQDTANQVENRVNTQAYAMLGTAALFDERNRYNGDFGDMLEVGWDEGDDVLKETLKKIIN